MGEAEEVMEWRERKGGRGKVKERERDMKGE